MEQTDRHSAIGTGGTLGTAHTQLLQTMRRSRVPRLRVALPCRHGYLELEWECRHRNNDARYKLEVNGTVGMGALTATTGTFSGNILLNDGSANSPDITFKQLAELGLWIWMDLLFEY